MRWKIIQVALLISLAINAKAACTADRCVADQNDKIKRIYLTSLSDGQVYIEAPSGKENLDCTLAEGKFMVLKASHPLFKETYSTLLAAVMANKSINIRIKNGSTKCEVAYIQLLL